MSESESKREAASHIKFCINISSISNSTNVRRYVMPAL